jgi:hypothetical protein
MRNLIMLVFGLLSFITRTHPPAPSLLKQRGGVI